MAKRIKVLSDGSIELHLDDHAAQAYAKDKTVNAITLSGEEAENYLAEHKLCFEIDSLTGKLQLRHKVWRLNLEDRATQVYLQRRGFQVESSQRGRQQSNLPRKLWNKIKELVRSN